MAITPIKGKFMDEKPPVYKRVMKDKYHVNPLYYVKMGYGRAILVKGNRTAHITDSQFW